MDFVNLLQEVVVILKTTMAMELDLTSMDFLMVSSMVEEVEEENVIIVMGDLGFWNMIRDLTMRQYISQIFPIFIWTIQMHKTFALLRGFCFWHRCGASKDSFQFYGDGDYNYGDSFGNGASRYENFDCLRQTRIGSSDFEYDSDEISNPYLFLEEKDA